MRADLLELIYLTQLHIYENFPKKAFKECSKGKKIDTTFSQIPKKPNLFNPEVKELQKKEEKTTKTTLSLTNDERKESTEKKLTPSKIVQPLLDLKEIEKLFLEKLPHIKIIKNPLDDSVALEKAQEWKKNKTAEYAILFSERRSAEECSFLQNIFDVIQFYQCSVKLIPLKEFPLKTQLKGIIGYKEDLESSFLSESKIPLLLLEPYNNYKKNRKAKEKLLSSMRSFFK